MPIANEPRALWPILFIVFVALAAGGCSTSNTTSELSLVDGQGNHPAGWIAAHPSFALPDGSRCVTCHGSVTSAAESGGISGVSCFLASRNGQGCHAGGPGAAPHLVGNPDWWTTPPAAQPHGNSAKAAPGISSGFAYCQGCHGAGMDFSGGFSGVSCYTCHEANAPHPSQWTTGDTYVHRTTDEANASVCAFCHMGGANSPIPPPSPPAAAGTPPGCFNNTLCHGAGGGHPAGWVAAPPAAQPHGNSAKAAPGASSGFAFCQVCHGSDFTGGFGTSCLNNGACHGTGVQSPHPPQWFQGDTYAHIDTDEGNAPVCGLCHYNEPGAGAHTPTPPPAGVTVGCFNNTLCHGASLSLHPAGWFVRSPGPQPHGQSAKGAPSGTSGFSYCRICHGTSTGNYNGGAVQFSCQIVACHGGGGLSPHAAQWLPGDTYSHTSTNTGNAPECAFCHYGESGGGNHPPTPPPAGSTPGCTNNTLCHGA